MASLGVSWSEAGYVVVSTVGIYLAFLVLLRIVGQRASASMSSFDFAAAIAVGAVMGRSLLGYTPTLLAGVIGLATLFALQTAFGMLRRTPRLQALMSNPPVVLLRDGHVLHGNLRAARRDVRAWALRRKRCWQAGAFLECGTAGSQRRTLPRLGAAAILAG